MKSTTDSGYKADNLPEIKELLKGWIQAQEDYSRAADGDFLGRHHERACIGFLAAAAWRNKGVALEEWRHDRGIETTLSKGRCDLWVFKRDVYEFHIEAKRLWTSAEPKKAKMQAEAKLRDAVKAASTLNVGKAPRLGILFVSPFYKVGNQNDLTSRVTEWLEAMREISHDAIAWQMQDKTQLRATSKWAQGPGLVLLARRF